MPAAAEELTDPVGYSPVWAWLAVAAIVVVVAWYAGVTLWAHARGWAATASRPTPVSARQRALGDLDLIAAQVASGDLPERAGYQQMSRVVRAFVAEVTGMPTHSMALADLQAAGVHGVAEAVALMYPPEFAPAPAPQLEPLDQTLARARHLVATWT